MTQNTPSQSLLMRAGLAAVASLTLASGAAMAQDAEAGAKDFNRCKSCHAITSPDGEKIVKGGKTGPNLYGIVGRALGTDPEYKGYSDTLVALGEGGMVWDDALLTEYIPNARDFLKTHSGDDTAKSAMTPQKVKSIENLVAFLASNSPE